jgi:hypothetical protein
MLLYHMFYCNIMGYIRRSKTASTRADAAIPFVEASFEKQKKLFYASFGSSGSEGAEPAAGIRGSVINSAWFRHPQMHSIKIKITAKTKKRFIPLTPEKTK